MWFIIIQSNKGKVSNTICGFFTQKGGRGNCQNRYFCPFSSIFSSSRSIFNLSELFLGSNWQTEIKLGSRGIPLNGKNPLRSILQAPIREGFKKSKWKFKMVFAMKGGGLEFHIPILKNDFFENHLESFSNC